MILANFLEDGFLLKELHFENEEIDEREITRLREEGFVEISEEDLELYHSLDYVYNKEKNSPEKLSVPELPQEELDKTEADRINKELKEYTTNSMMRVFAGDDIDVYRQEYSSKLRSIPDGVALYMTNTFSQWSIGKGYIVDDKIVYNNILYKVILNHTSQESWLPDQSPSLYVKVIRQTGEEIPEWEQPTANNAYMKGDKVRYQNKVYESLIDNNVWSPDDYPQGWLLIE